MRSKQTALVKDLARLLTKYSARDWQPFIRLLTLKPSLLEKAILAQAREAEARPTKTRRAKGPRNVTTKLPAKDRVLRKSPVVASTKPKKSKAAKVKPKAGADRLTGRYQSLLGNVPLGHLQTLYLQAYRDKRIPKGRGEITAALERHLQKLTKDERARFLSYLNQRPDDSAENFERWVEIISKGKPGD